MQINNNLLQQIKNCYDIRSTDISNKDAFLLGQAFGSEIIERGKNKVVVGYDRRKNSKTLHNHFVEGLLHSGIHVISIGRAATPVIQIAEFILDAHACVSITASHNPPEYHGFKFFLDKFAFADQNLAKLISRILQNHMRIATGRLEEIAFLPQYGKIISDALNITGTFKIAWDCLNGSGADSMPHLTEALRGTHYIINHENDPTFGNCAPDPHYEPRLERIRHLINMKHLDFGILIDGDADRCVILDSNGKLIQGDVILALFGYFTYKTENRNIKMVWDSKSSNLLVKWSKSFAESYISTTGHSNVHNLLRKYEADVAGECSGHYMFSKFFGVNDGIYAALNFISSLEKNNMTLNEALNILPTVWIAPQKSINCPEEKKDEIIRKIYNILVKQGVTIDAQDGIKACYSYGWWMIRPSRTEETLRISAEGWTQDGLDSVKDELNSILASLDI